ncbi:hypothetical protein R5R35_009093 [Gryllus longicercus]|uniref:Uncharacterized protein n=1 Tax=Gryllus longicercus TaxID=2509291 RepID=A0AAN9ZB63_9ORTH
MLHDLEEEGQRRIPNGVSSISGLVGDGGARLPSQLQTQLHSHLPSQVPSLANGYGGVGGHRPGSGGGGAPNGLAGGLSRLMGGHSNGVAPAPNRPSRDTVQEMYGAVESYPMDSRL